MRALLIVTILLVLASPLNAQILPAEAGQIGLFPDPNGLNCNITDTFGLITLYAVHVNHEGAAFVDFKVEPGPGVVATWISDTDVLSITNGNSPTGVSIIYGGCFQTPTHVLSVTYQFIGASSDCSEFVVSENLNTPQPWPATTLCTEAFRREVRPKNLVVNPTGQCTCTVATEHKTWGAIKAIYQN